MLPNLDGKFDISLYTSAVYIIIVVAAIVSIIAFFGCFGAVKVKLNLFSLFVDGRALILNTYSKCSAHTSLSTDYLGVLHQKNKTINSKSSTE